MKKNTRLETPKYCGTKAREIYIMYIYIHTYIHTYVYVYVYIACPASREGITFKHFLIYIHGVAARKVEGVVFVLVLVVADEALLHPLGVHQA